MRKHHSDPLALVRRILSARKSMLKVPLSIHEEIARPQEPRGEAAYDHQRV